jgi:hypothetical protein
MALEGVFVMPGDPKKIRERAARCRSLANSMATPKGRQLFLELAGNWEAELESAPETKESIPRPSEPTPSN